MTLVEKQEKIAFLNAEIELLQSSVDRYHTLSQEKYKLVEEIAKTQKEQKRTWLEIKTEFKDCVFPEIGSSGECGSAVFESLDQANELLESINVWGRNTYYQIKWEGSGLYDLIPHTSQDWRDNDMCYTGTFRRNEE